MINKIKANRGSHTAASVLYIIVLKYCVSFPILLCGDAHNLGNGRSNLKKRHRIGYLACRKFGAVEEEGDRHILGHQRAVTAVVTSVV